MPVTPAIDEAIEMWLSYLEEMNVSPHTLRSYGNALTRLRTWLDAQSSAIDLPSSELAGQDAQLNITLLTHYIQTLQAEQLQYATLRSYIGITVDWLTDLYDRGVIPGMPGKQGRMYKPEGVRKALMHLLTKPRVQQQAPRIPSLLRLPAYYPERLEEFRRTHGVPALDQGLTAPGRSYLNLLRNAALIATLFCTGGRIAEVLSLNTRELRNRSKIVHDVRLIGKGNKERRVHLNEQARESIHHYLTARDRVPIAQLPHTGTDIPLFLSHGPNKPGHRLTQFSAWRIVRDAADALADLRMEEGAPATEIQALRQVSPHTFRHFVGQALLDEGTDIKTVAEYLGHSSTVVTERVYARPDPDRVLEEVDTFGPRASRSFRRTDHDS